MSENKIYKYFVTGIDTNVGKTIIAAIVAKKLNADYWKPIQAGDLDHKDSDKVKKLLGNTESSNTSIHPEAYALRTPASPHHAAALDGVRIRLENINLPDTNRNLVVEGAGGLLVPINEQHFIIDVIEKLGLPVLLVAGSYLGSINHTLLSIEILKHRNLPIAGIIFSGKRNEATERAIQDRIGAVKVLGAVPFLEDINEHTIQQAGLYINI